FCLAALVRVNETVPVLTSRLAALTAALSIGLFIYLVDHVGKLLRPSGALQAVSRQAHRIIGSVYPRPLQDAPPPHHDTVNTLANAPMQSITSKRAGVVLAFDVRGLVALAARHDCLVEMIPQVGDFVAPGNPLFRVYGNAQISAELLRASMAIGAERTME